MRWSESRHCELPRPWQSKRSTRDLQTTLNSSSGSPWLVASKSATTRPAGIAWTAASQSTRPIRRLSRRKISAATMPRLTASR
ncbi:hypothetical protein ACFPRL_22980 [Pseudoclavibacter helvolus]